MTEAAATNTGLVKFGGITKEAAEKARKKVKSGSRSFFEWKDGMNIIRMIPPKPGEEASWVITSQHFFKNWSGGKKHFAFNCPKEMGQGRCPACDQYDALMATGNPVDKERAKDFKPKSRVFAPVIDRKDEEAGVQVAAFGSMILEQMTELIEDDDVYGADFTHPFEGDDLAIKRYDDKGFTRYKVNIRNGDNDRLAETEEQMVKWIESTPNLEQYAVVLSYEVLLAKANELTAEARGEVSAPAIAAPQPKPEVVDPPADTPAPADSTAFGEAAAGGLQGAAASEEGQTATTPF